MQAVVNDSITWCAMNYVPVVSAHEHGVRGNARRIQCCFRWCLVCSYIEYTEWAVSACLQHVYVCDATRAVPRLARQNHAYLLFISNHGFLLDFTPLRRAVFTQYLCSQDLLHWAKHEKSVRNKYLSFTLYVMLLGITNSMRRVIKKLVVPLLLKEIPLT
jgi:hypothetical protein